MICVLGIPGISLILSADKVDLLFYGSIRDVEAYFRGEGTYVDLSASDLKSSGWDYAVMSKVIEKTFLILDLDFDFRRIGHSPFVFVVGEKTATVGEFCHHLRHQIRGNRIDSLLG
jgi:hypothetical protein